MLPKIQKRPEPLTVESGKFPANVVFFVGLRVLNVKERPILVESQGGIYRDLYSTRS